MSKHTQGPWQVEVTRANLWIGTPKGSKIDTALLDKLSDQQVGQMYELMQAIQKRGRDSVDEEEEDALLRAIDNAAGPEKKDS